ncbi:DUF2271 domain-containing protein [Deinococcus detaillensis]|uniref:DUF2271 domain-containing protein n=1 Tax=Deinococcus detaillensis TaxID=2592048 RepID=A0A553V2X3_9DEIO|nr:DUF2271 domain-containing protein [Deinococcus detaillensis]TSA86837.1 DUF2271 domain-containing protein [Deinococcus detaillensis]
MTDFKASNPQTRRHFLERALKLSVAAAATLTLSRLGVTSASAAAAPAALPSTMELAVNLTLAAPSGFRYNRPYVAVYIEDAQGNPVRTLSLWAETNRHARYLSDLRRWFSQSSDLVATVSSPTRNPGSYSLVWDGRTDAKKPAAQGDYFVCVENAREHGPYGLVREKITLGTTPLKKTLDSGSDADLSSVTVDYRKKA